MLDVLFVIVTVLLCFYLMQMVLAVINATKKIDGKSSVIERLFNGSNKVTNTWFTFGVGFVFPVLISWLVGISEDILNLDSGEALYVGCSSMLLVLITLELAQLNEINENNKDPWRGLLLFALSLDLISIVVVSGFIKFYVSQGAAGVWTNFTSYVLMIGGAAFVSSFMILLFTRKAGESNG